MTGNQILVVEFGKTSETDARAILLSSDADTRPIKGEIKAIGGYLTDRGSEASYAWIVGDTFKDVTQTSDWTTVRLEDNRLVQHAWQLRTGLFLALAEKMRKEGAHFNEDLSVVLVDPSIPDKRWLPGWLRLVLERLGWSGRAIAFNDRLVSEERLYGDGHHEAPLSYSAFDKLLRRMSLEGKEHDFGQRRASFGLKFSGPGKNGIVHTVVKKGETFPMQSEHRIVREKSTQPLRWDLYLIYDPRNRPQKDPEIRLSPVIAGTPAEGVLFAVMEAEDLNASDPNGGVRIIFEVDRFGRLYLTLRDDFDRLIKMRTAMPQSSDGLLWSPDDPVLEPKYEPAYMKSKDSDYRKFPIIPADRIFVSVPFLQEPAKDVVSLWGWERLPGAIAATNFNGGACESYDHDLPSRQRRGATMDLVPDDITNAIKIHRDRWDEPGNKERELARRVVSESREPSSNSDLVEALAENLPEEMHHFRALLTQIAREVKSTTERMK
ncbi:MAG: hypothetical protein R3F50_18340 [Gammaproteobacteria bacterium]